MRRAFPSTEWAAADVRDLRDFRDGEFDALRRAELNEYVRTAPQRPSRKRDASHRLTVLATQAVLDKGTLDAMACAGADRGGL